MFQPNDYSDLGIDSRAAQAVTLEPVPAPAESPAMPAPGKLRALADRLRTMDWSQIDWAPDLAESIGSRRWMRGAATFAGLGLVALALWPNFELEAAPSMHGDVPVRDEYRSQMIMPLALGGESGRRMGTTALVTSVSSVEERDRVELAAVLGSGDTLTRLLQRAGVSDYDAARATELVAGQVPLGRIAPGTKISLVLGERPSPGEPRRLASLEMRARMDLSLAVSRSGDDLAIATRAIPVDSTPLRIRGVVGQSLYRSARAAGVPADAIQQYLQALDSHISLEGDIQPGDSFDIVMSWKRAEGAEGQVGQVLFAGLDRGSQPVVELMRWGNDNAFYSADAMTRPVIETETSGLLSPVSGRITSLFGMRRHPILGYARLHAGVDFGASWGSPIRATASGVVSYAGRHGGHGNYVRIDHGGGLGTGYGHMSSIVAWAGSRVQAGQIIGYVGSTGLSTGPHLHYEMYRNGRTVNPLGASYATTTTVVQKVDPKQLAAFKARMSQLKAIRAGGSMGAVAMARTGAVSLR
ncbi:MAG: M23 family metallopeptidase [Novosphingobium sp.]